MCNLRYEYRKDDIFAIALQKAVKALCDQGVKVYNFPVNTDAICPADIPFDKLFVTRERLNGTFVLAAPQQRVNQDSTWIVAYLVTTLHGSGSYLFESDEDGNIEMMANSAWRSDMLHTGYNSALQMMQGKVKLEKTSACILR